MTLLLRMFASVPPVALAGLGCGHGRMLVDRLAKKRMDMDYAQEPVIGNEEFAATVASSLRPVT